MEQAALRKSEQALLNEYKGNLFEYLVANELARHFQVQEAFILGINEQYRAMFNIQERFIRARFPNLVNDLPKLAHATANKIIEIADISGARSVTLIGKGNNSFTSGSELSSADILLEGGKRTPISLKLSKHSAFVNTRSGGIKSFIQKYFPFGDGPQLQQKYNRLLEEKFHQMAFALHEQQAVEYDLNFSNWVAMGLTEYPGQLEDGQKQLLHDLYCVLARQLQEYLYSLYKQSPQQFCHSLAVLMGMGSTEMVQAICFYKNINDHYELSEIYCQKDGGEEEALSTMEFDSTPTDTASFEIRFPHKILQIRIKPMNTFTSMAFKINCSVRYIN